MVNTFLGDYLNGIFWYFETMDINQIRLNNLTIILDEKFNGVRAALARKMEIAPNNISRYYSDNPKDKRNISDDAARLIESAAGKERYWMDRAHDADNENNHLTQGNTAQHEGNLNKVPLISAVSAGMFANSPDNYYPGDAETWIACPSKHSKSTFALRVNGDSMTSATIGEKSYPHGTVIFVDPERAMTNGCKVVVKLPNLDEAVFKKYVFDAGRQYLMPLNKQYETIPMPEDAVLCGVVIGSFLEE